MLGASEGGRVGWVAAGRAHRSPALTSYDLRGGRRETEAGGGRGGLGRGLPRALCSGEAPSALASPARPGPGGAVCRIWTGLA